MKFVPAQGCVLIKPLISDSALPSADRNYERMGEVIARPTNLGYASRPIFLDVEIGDIICFDEYAYRRFDYEGEEYCVVDVSSSGTNGGLWAIIKKDGSTEKPLQEEGVSS